jgi:hypothetical protein
MRILLNRFKSHHLFGKRHSAIGRGLIHSLLIKVALTLLLIALLISSCHHSLLLLLLLLLLFQHIVNLIEIASSIVVNYAFLGIDLQIQHLANIEILQLELATDIDLVETDKASCDV